MAPPVVPGGSMDPPNQLKAYEAYVKLLADPNAKDESKLQACQELSENFEIISGSSEYPNFLDVAIKVFLKVLREGEPHFIAEYNIHQVRKLILEMMYRIPTDKYLKPYAEQILNVAFKLLETENEENVHVCLRIIIELHKHYRPVYNAEIQHFLLFVRTIYQDLPDHVNKIFEPKVPIRVEKLADLHLDTLLNEIYTTTTIQIGKKMPDGTVSTKATAQYNLIPKGVLSLKVLQELPTIVVLMYELYKDKVLQEVNDYIPVIIKTITLQPLKQHRNHPSFNREVFVDFMGAQIKTLSFLAYIIRVYQEVFGKHSQQMLEGIINMLRLCPPKVTHLRKELLMAARHIWATDLRLMFVPYMETLFDEDVLLGQGWTTYESLRPLAYSTLADLVHHVRQLLPMSDLVKAVHIFSKNVHDDTLPTSIQTISCKLLLNLVDCIRLQTEKDPAQAQTGQDLLMRMLEVFVMKFKTIAKLHLPILIAKSKQAEIKTPASVPNMAATAAGAAPVKKEEGEAAPIVTLAINEPIQAKPEEREPSKCRFVFPPLQPTNYNVSDCCSLVKTLVCGVKAITWRFKADVSPRSPESGRIKTLKLQLFKPKETEVFIRFVKWALQALDVYTLSMKPPTLGMAMTNQRPLPQQTVRTKEEKDALEHFSGVFSVMNAQTFREIFSTTIDFIVERMAANFALQIVGNSFLTHPETSPLFATVLVEYLLGRMEEMGNGNMERSNLYLKLFKLVFGSVSLFAAANEHMLRPHLHQIVNRSMELAMTAKEPYNYFLLLRTLFRSIGGGNHDLLYQEFLPLLPNLLQGLNSLQSGLHKQHMKDLFVELCLTVPVRLSSLLPYLPMLMDPLVSALNGSPTLISQGLRTLELCVDNLQPDFLYDHIQPVRADLMQALWRSLRNPTDQVAHVAFRVLGKFGGGNRKMMIEPQKLDYHSDTSPQPALVLVFPEYEPISLPMNRVIDSALTVLKSSNADGQFYRQKSWCIVRDYLFAAMNLDDNKQVLFALLTHEDFKTKAHLTGQFPSQGLGDHQRRPDPIKFSKSQQYQCNNKIARQTHVNALIGMFFALLNKEMAAEVQPIFEMIVRHFTLVAISHQAGPFSEGLKQSNGMDPLVIVDAIASVMGNEEKELCKPGRSALNLILGTAEVIMGSKDAACRLPLMEYVAEKMYSLCYDRAWYTKRGGCLAIMFLYESMSLRWVYQHLFVFVKAQLFVIMDLTGEVSSGAIDQAKANLEALIKLCAPLVVNGDRELQLVQKKALDDVTLELTRQVTSPTDLIREQSMHLLQVFAQAQGTTVVKVMEQHKKVLEDMIPKIHHLRLQAANAQIGIMEGNTFCTSLTPRLFCIDLGTKEHEVFFQEVQHLCEAADEVLLKMPCYKNVGSFVPLRKAAMRALAAFHYVPNASDKIFNTFYRCLEKENQELQEAAFQCMKTFVAGAQIDMNAVHEIMRPLLSTLGNYRNINLSGARRLSYLVQLFPSSFNEMLCEQLKQHLKELLENMMQTQKGISKNGDTEQIVATIISIFHQIPAAGPRFIEPLSQLVLQTERNLLVGASSPFRHPLLKFLLRYPQDTINLLLSDNQIKDDLWSKYLEYLIKHDEGRPFREVLQSPQSVERLIAMALAPKLASTLTAEERLELQFQSIRIVSLLVKYDDQWLSTQQQLAQTFNQIWCNDQYQQRHRSIETVEYVHWKEPKLLVKILLNYFSHHPSNIDLLFNLLRAFCDRYLPNFQFLKDFLETIVAQSYTVEWKRMAFFRFVELFPQNIITQRLKAKILQYIIIPCFANCFEKGEGDRLIGSPPAPNFDSSDNVVSEFINKIIDPENPSSCGDSVRILILQLSCLLVEQCVSHIHDSVANKPQGSKLRRLMTYAWPCLLSNNCVDPATKYHGHLLLSHVIAKLAIHSEPYPRIVLQVFRSLLKAHALEVRPVVRQALEILTPAMPARMEDGYKMLTHWTKKIIVEEGHSMQQLFHILQLVVRHYAVYYPVRHNLLRHMVTALQRLGFSASSSLEHKKLGCELAEIIIRWEHQRIKDENQMAQESGDSLKRSASSDDPSEPPRKKGPAVISIKHDPDEMKPLEKTHADILINTLMRLACSVNETSNNPVGMTSPGEVLSRRCYNLVRMALKPDVWPDYTIDFRLQWMDKIFCSIEQPNPNLGNICVGLELFTLALTFMKKEQVLAQCKLLQKGINACISSNNTRVIRLSHLLLTRLMNYYPTEPSTAVVSSKHAELECIYSSVGRVIFDGLNNYEKNTNANSSCLFGAIMMLKAACSSNPSYVDRLITPFIRVIQRMTREHLNSSSETPAATSDLLIHSLDLVKNRVGVMQTETKKAFIGSILVGLIEKTSDSKVMKSICKMVEEWMKNSKPTGPGAAINNGPSLREKSILLGKLMQFVEKRFPDLNTQFLELVNYVYREETFKTTELIPKLEPAFLAGLRCNQPHIRAKFFEIFDQSIRRRLHDRLMYIVSSQNWEPMGQHYWIKQCIEIILVTADESVLLQLSKETPTLPGVTSVMNHVDDDKRELFAKSSTISFAEAMDPSKKTLLQTVTVDSESQLHDFAKKTKLIDFLNCVIQLCHTDSSLAEKLWLDLFPRLWSLLTERQRTSLSGEILPFLVSGCHVAQKDIHPSALSTIFEAISLCNPPLQIKPALMSYLGKSHNLWHMVTLSLEKMVADQTSSSIQNKARRELECYDFEPVDAATPQQASIEYLADMYSKLKEEDMWCALWQKHARYKETSIALAYEQQGNFEQAQGAYELALGKGRQDFSNSPAPISLLAEERLWEEQWIRCSKELNQWDHLLEYARTKGSVNPLLILESAWRVPDWQVEKEAITQVETACPKEYHWKVHLYRGYLTICIPEDQHLPIIERYVELASALCMKEWRRLPHIVSHIHLPLLQAAQQIMELQEACQIHQGLIHERNNSLQELKSIVKTWRNRLPIISDDLSHWSDIFTWRQHHYQFIIKHVDAKHDQGTNSSMFGVHASAQAIIHFGKIARKHNLTGVCLDSLARIYTIPSVPVVDCFHKIRQQVKCHLQMAISCGTKELQEGLEVMESSDISYFTNEMTSEFLALKGMLLAQLGQIGEAKNTFSVAVQRHDTLVKAWALWGDFVESQFTKSSPPDISLGVNAITCFLHACRHQNESKSRKYLAKVLWLLTYDDDKNSLTEAVDKYVIGVPPIQWLPWIPQLLTCLVWNEGRFMLNILSQVGRMFLQAVYLPIRTLYLTLKIEHQLERYKSAEQQAGRSQLNPGMQQQQHGRSASDTLEAQLIKATESMRRCTRIMHILRDAHPTVVLSLEGFVDQFVWLREIWYEEVLRQLKQGLAKCYVIAFENRGAVSEATITPHTLHFVMKVVSTFGIGIENIKSPASSSVISSASESLAKRAEVTIQDPDFKKMKEQFTVDFDFTQPGAMKLQNFIQKLKKWIRILEAKTKLLPKSFLIEEKCRFISSFSLQTVEIELPGEFLLPKHSHYYVKISRFMPRVELVQKHNTAARRLFIRGHNGKIYPYLVVNDSGLSVARREERVLQLLRMLNHYLGKQKETSRRFLHITVPRVVAWSPQMRLIEDNPASVSLLDVYKGACSALDIEHDAPVTKYYDRLASVQARGMQASHQILKDILKDVQTTMISKTLLKDWALRAYPSPTDYWTFRKMFTLQLSLTCFCEYVLHLTRLNPDMLYIHQDSGLLNVSYFKFDVEDTKGELNANRPVPFRLSPNIQELLTETGISGPLTASMIATAKCLVHPNFEVTSILRAILRDEMIFMLNKPLFRQEDKHLNTPPSDVKGEQIITVVTHAINSINSRLNSLSHFEGTESKVSTLVVAAKSPDNLCRMDPAWHPWL